MIEKALEEFIQQYVEGSKIEKVIYNNETKKWTITYSYDVPDDEFDSPKQMIAFMDADQFGE